MEIIRPGRPEEGEQLKCFAEESFFTEDEASDFAELLPKVYRNPASSAQRHLVLEVDGERKGLLYCPVTELDIGTRKLKVGHIGSVCVAADYRGRGGMQRLMERAMERLKKEDCVLAALSGQRQRYEYYGFVPTGTKTEFVFYDSNIPSADMDCYSLRQLEAADLDSVYSLFLQNNPHMGRRREELMDILGSWSAKAMVLCLKGSICGYFTFYEQEGYRVISELRLKEAGMLKPLCRLLFVQKQQALKICLMPGIPEYDLAVQLCERYIIGPDHNMCILQFVPVLEALLCRKSCQAALPRGTVHLYIEDMGCLEMCVDENGPGVCWCENEAADIRLSYAQAVHFLFSPLSVEREAWILDYPLLAAWFPLPICLEQNDCF